MVDRYPEAFELARTADDIVRIHKAGKIASLIGIEGGHSDRRLARDAAGAVPRGRALHDADALVQQLDWADSATDAPQHGGLTPFGETVVREMNRLGMLVDLSHVSTDTMSTALDVSRGAGDLLALLRPGHRTTTRATCPTTCCSASRPTAAS